MAQTKSANRPDTKSTDTRGAAPQAAPSNNLPAEQPKKQHPLVAFKDYAEQRMATLHNALPPHISQNAFMSVVMTALQKKPDLLKCTRQSLWNACVDAANLGLLPDGIEGAIAPYGQNENGARVAEIATFMPMIGGYRKLAYEGGLIASWEVNVVRQRDHFDFALGDEAFIEHRPYFGAEDPGGVIGAYSIAKLKDGSILRDVMGLFDLNRIKAKSKASKGPWSDPAFEPEMHRKTMGRRHYKQLPKTPALSRLIERDNADFDLDSKSDVLIEQRQTRRLTSTTEAFDQFAGAQAGAADDDGFGEFDDEAPTDNRPQQDAPAARQDYPASQKLVAREAEQPTKRHAARMDDQQAGDDVPNSETNPSEKKQQSASTPDQNASYDERRWPSGEVPSNPDEYEHYVETKLSDFTNGDDISPWWKSKDETDLRRACGVSQQMYNDLRNKAANRATELRKPKA